MNALFHSVMPAHGRVQLVDIGALREPSRLLTEVLMFIGGGSASTAGGIKVTTFALLGWVMWAEVRGDPDVVVFERRIPDGAQRQALTVALLAIGVVIAPPWSSLATSDLPRGDLCSRRSPPSARSACRPNLTPAAVGDVAARRSSPDDPGPGRAHHPVRRARAARARPAYRHPEERPIIG